MALESAGPMWVVAVALVLATLSVVGVGMAVAAVTRTVVKAFVVANFPLAVLMFFSGAMFPMPRVTWFELAGHPVGPFDVLAPTHAVTVLNRVATLGDSFGDVVVDLALLTVLTAVYLAVGVVLLRRAASGPAGPVARRTLHAVRVRNGTRRSRRDRCPDHGPPGGGTIPP